MRTIIVLICVMTLGMVELASALDLQFTTTNTATASDNIDRSFKGNETGGYLLTIEGDLNLAHNFGAGSVNLLLGGGIEMLRSDETRNSENYRLGFSARIPWTGTGYVEGSANTSEETEDPEITDITQARFRTRRSDARLAVGRRPTRNFGWLVSAESGMERHAGRDLIESQEILNWDFILKRGRTLAFEFRFIQGNEDVTGDSWTGNITSADFTKRIRPSVEIGCGFSLESQEVEQNEGNLEQSDMVSVSAYYEKELPTGWSYTGELGADGIKPVLDDRHWESRAAVSFESAQDRRVELNGSFSISSSTQDPVEEQVAWTREGEALMSLQWQVARIYVVEPLIQYRLAEYFGKSVPDWTTRTTLLEISTRWFPSRTWHLDMNVVSETVDSSEPDNDLVENRFEVFLSADLI